MLQVRSAIGFCSTPRFHVEPSDFVRIAQVENVTLAMLANGHQGFGSGCPEAARLALDTVQEIWPQTTGGLQTRLLDVFRVAEERVSTLPENKDESGFDDGPPIATLLVVARLGATACVAWVGSDVAVHVRGARITKTRPHTMYEDFRDKHGDIPNLNESFRHITLRRLGNRGTNADKPPSFTSFSPDVGDAIVLVRNDEVDCAPIVKEAAAHADPATLSRRLAEHAFKERKFFSAVAVLRFDEFGSPYR